MYLRHSRIRKDGKTHTYWRLVRSVRRGGKVFQETVAQLGELDARGRAKASALARHFLGEKGRQLELFDDGASAEAAKPRLGAVAKRMGEIVEAVEELGEPKDVAALEERMRKGLEPVSAAIEGYLERIQGVPGMEAILMEPFRAVTGRVAEW